MRLPRRFYSNMRSHSRGEQPRATVARVSGASRRIARLWIAIAVSSLAGCRVGPPGEAQAFARVMIPAGASFAGAADSLHSAGLVRWPSLFRGYASLSGRDRSIKAGTYVLHRRSSWDALLNALTRGEGLERAVTIPEGFEVDDISTLLTATLGLSPESLAVAVRDTSLRRRLDVPTLTVEGYLFPDTYRFPYGTSARAAVAEMVRRFEEVWDPAWNARLRELAMSRHDVVTLASIVEKEARLDEERAVIAAVYHNRLRAQMPLQADPTVQYALGEHRSRVLYRDLALDSPYNTYRYAGLPPGPIASPGRASLVAALYPASVPYKFFVAHPDGHHEFRETFREHRIAVREMQRARRDAERRSGGR